MFDSIPFGVTLPASDMERAKAWYETMLGLTPADDDDSGVAWYETGGVRFMLYLSEFAGTNQATAASLTVSDFDGAIALLRTRGAVFDAVDFGEFKTVNGVLEMPDGRSVAWLKDSEGNTLAITSE
jgi:predicted enzyme related to lactoylglutathione lyase